jgi:NADH dehydrogenase/NADH:ubiquinone oxidoreductase subunit G
MQFTIEVNNKSIKAEKGETILSALNRNGIIIPTLCRMQEFTPTGACRMCVVEVEGRDRLVTACSALAEEWMKIQTHSPRVIRARKTIVELLLSILRMTVYTVTVTSIVSCRNSRTRCR